ncbi:mannitol repressor protein [Citrobacter freundii]|nr:mannitol repressor protein [Citrobacter freundii]
MIENVAQVSLRPNDRLSDMQAIMEQTQAFENRVLERLNAGKTVRSFLITAVELLTEAVNILVLQVFRKDDYAVKICGRTTARRRRSTGRSFRSSEANLRPGRTQPAGI